MVLKIQGVKAPACLTIFAMRSSRTDPRPLAEMPAAFEPVLTHDLPPELSAQAARALRLRNARREITERRRITRRLQEALSTGGFQLHYQPIYTLEGQQARGVEALIRLQHRRRGLIPPAQFMPVAERSEIIHDITGWMLMQACREAAQWRHGVAAIRLPLPALRSGRLVKLLLEALSGAKLPAERLELELTEAMLVDEHPDTLFALNAFRALGVRLALNHFGLGTVSLNAARRLSLTVLRLDGALIRQLGANTPEAAIAKAVIEAGHALGCTTLADGVETAAQYQQLRRLGCDEGQGSFFSQPLTAREAGRLFGA